MRKHERRTVKEGAEHGDGEGPILPDVRARLQMCHGGCLVAICVLLGYF